MNGTVERTHFERLQRRLVHVSDGKKCRVVKIVKGINPKSFNRRINITPGMVIKVEGRGPFGSPIRISFKGMQITIGINSAHQIIVEPLD